MLWELNNMKTNSETFKMQLYVTYYWCCRKEKGKEGGGEGRGGGKRKRIIKIRGIIKERERKPWTLANRLRAMWEGQSLNFSPIESLDFLNIKGLLIKFHKITNA